MGFEKFKSSKIERRRERSAEGITDGHLNKEKRNKKKRRVESGFKNRQTQDQNPDDSGDFEYELNSSDEVVDQETEAPALLEDEKEPEGVQSTEDENQDKAELIKESRKKPTKSYSFISGNTMGQTAEAMRYEEDNAPFGVQKKEKVKELDRVDEVSEDVGNNPTGSLNVEKQKMNPEWRATFMQLVKDGGEDFFKGVQSLSDLHDLAVAHDSLFGYDQEGVEQMFIKADAELIAKAAEVAANKYRLLEKELEFKVAETPLHNEETVDGVLQGQEELKSLVIDSGSKEGLKLKKTPEQRALDILNEHRDEGEKYKTLADAANVSDIDRAALATLMTSGFTKEEAEEILKSEGRKTTKLEAEKPRTDVYEAKNEDEQDKEVGSTEFMPINDVEEVIVLMYENDLPIDVKNRSGEWGEAKIKSISRDGILIIEVADADGNLSRRAVPMKSVVRWFEEKQRGESESVENPIDKEAQEDPDTKVPYESVDDSDEEQERIARVRESLKSKKELENGYDPSESYQADISMDSGLEKAFAYGMDEVFEGVLTTADQKAFLEEIEGRDLAIAVDDLKDFCETFKKYESPKKYYKRKEGQVDSEIKAFEEILSGYNDSKKFVRMDTSFSRKSREAKGLFTTFDKRKKLFESKSGYIRRMWEDMKKDWEDSIKRIKSTQMHMRRSYGDDPIDVERREIAETKVKRALEKVNEHYAEQARAIKTIDEYPKEYPSRERKGLRNIYLPDPGGVVTRIMSIVPGSSSRRIRKEYKQARALIGMKKNGSKTKYLKERVQQKTEALQIEKDLHEALGEIPQSERIEKDIEGMNHDITIGLGHVLDMAVESDEAVKVLRQRLGEKKIKSYNERTPFKEVRLRLLMKHKQALERIKKASPEMYAKIGGVELVELIDQRYAFFSR